MWVTDCLQVLEFPVGKELPEAALILEQFRSCLQIVPSAHHTHLPVRTPRKNIALESSLLLRPVSESQIREAQSPHRDISEARTFLPLC